MQNYQHLTNCKGLNGNNLSHSAYLSANIFVFTDNLSPISRYCFSFGVSVGHVTPLNRSLFLGIGSPVLAKFVHMVVIFSMISFSGSPSLTRGHDGQHLKFKRQVET